MVIYQQEVELDQAQLLLLALSWRLRKLMEKQDINMEMAVGSFSHLSLLSLILDKKSHVDLVFSILIFPVSFEGHNDKNELKIMHNLYHNKLSAQE